MPIYAYRCETCGFQQDVLQKMSDARLTMCPSCGNPTLQKQVTAAGFQLKGSGWYVTDFRNPAAKPGAKSEGATAETKSDTSTEGGGGDAKNETPSTGKNAETTSPAPVPAAASDAKPAPAPAKTPASGAA